MGRLVKITGRDGRRNTAYEHYAFDSLRDFRRSWLREPEVTRMTQVNCVSIRSTSTRKVAGSKSRGSCHLHQATCCVTA